MRKLLLTSVLLGLACTLGCWMSPQMSWALDNAVPIAPGVAAKAAVPRQLRHRARHARSRHAENKIAATRVDTMTGRTVALANAPAPADIAALAHSGNARPSAAAGTTEAAPASPSKAVPEGAAPQPQAPNMAKVKSAEQLPVPHEVRQFCANTATAAADARVAWQAAKLTELAVKLRQRIAELEAKRAEYEDWLHRHDEAMKEASQDVVAIYSRMRPDAAAAQLSAMDEVMAASLLTKLDSRVASAIFAEMDPGRAARIANAMVGPVSATGGKKS